MAPRRPHTREYDPAARDRLGKAVIRAREKAGFTWNGLMAAAGIGKTSLFNLERGMPVGPKVYEAVARALPGWSMDTPIEILDGGEVPAPAVASPPLDLAALLNEEVPIEEIDEQALLAIVTDRSKLGTDEHLEALATLYAADLLTKEAFTYGLAVNRKVRKARESVDREIAELQRSLTERVQSDLSG